MRIHHHNGTVPKGDGLSSAQIFSHTLPQAANRKPVIDRFGRRLSYLRVSVTELCNLSCHYCNPVKGCPNTHEERLSWDDLLFLVDVAVNQLGVEAIRITGGEPTVRPGLPEWIAAIRRFPSLVDVAMTTNGILLEKMAPSLQKAGLDRVNISIDTFDEQKYADITRGGDLKRCMRSIEIARNTFRRVKLNAVLLRDFNVAELDRFIAYSDQHEVEVRFIELMPLFEQKDYFHRHFVSVENVMNLLAANGFDLLPEGQNVAEGRPTGYGPAATYRIAGTRARIGFISQMSNTKCSSCNKLRMTSDGALKPCLLSPQEVDLASLIRNRDHEAVAAAMRTQFMERAEQYDVMEALNDPFRRGMQATGG